MMPKNKGKETFRPYARLITILGDQLITNKIVAVNEIVKNSYDADAHKVTVSFNNLKYFGKPKKDIPKGFEPYIEIIDDGEGMTINTILDVWLKPATPNKIKQKKRQGDIRLTKKRRIMQGEKGIGRFAVQKLGDDIEIYSKIKNGKEAELKVDFGQYDQDKQLDLFTEGVDNFEYKFLDEVENEWSVNDLPKEISNEKGTLIRIKNLRETWTSKELIRLKKSFHNLVAPIIPDEDKKLLDLDIELVKDFEINIEINGADFDNLETNVTFEKVAKIAPFKFVGHVNSDGMIEYKYFSTLEGKRFSEDSFSLLNHDKDITLSSIKSRFFEEDKTTKQLVQIREPKCGDFKFILYGYDLFDKAKWKVKKDELQFIRNHNVFLYRDGVRVYPYGDPGNDWLELGKRRSEERAGLYFSNNDLIGFIFISHEENKLLKDATNREGVMDQDGAFEDFRALLIASVQVMKLESDIDKGKSQLKKQAPIKKIQHSLNNDFNQFIKKLKKIDNKPVLDAANKYLNSSKNYVDEMTRRAEIYEDLAGLGMAVEKASHDTLTLLNKMNLNLGDIKRKLLKGNMPTENLIEIISDLEDNTYFLYEQLQVIEPLFRNEKRSETIVSIKDNASKVIRYFNYELSNYGIDAKIICSQDIKLEIGSGLMLQILINLMDNAIYWIRTKGAQNNRRIVIKIDGTKNELIFADTGPGIDESAIPYIFLEFFTRKQGKVGRGLGLFIVKEILDRFDASISVISSQKDKIEEGANFKISFSKDEL